jgi:hypothetical protein
VDQNETVDGLASETVLPIVADVTIDGAAENAVATAVERFGVSIFSSTMPATSTISH